MTLLLLLNQPAAGGGPSTYTRAAAIRAEAATAAARLLRSNRSATVTETVTTRAARVKVAPRAGIVEAAPLALASRRVTARRDTGNAQAIEMLSTSRFVLAIRSAIMDVASPSAVVARALRARRAAVLSESPATRAAGGLVSTNVLPGVGSLLGVAPPLLARRDALALRQVGAAILARIAPPSLSALTPPRLERIR